MLKKIIETIWGTKHTRDIKRLIPIVQAINQIYESYASLTDEQLRAKTQEFKDKIHARVRHIRNAIEELQAQLKDVHGTQKVDFYEIRDRMEELEKQEKEATEAVLWEILPEAYAAVKETCRRLLGKSWKVVGHDIVWDMVPFDVQLMGAIVLHEGKIAEMATGEGTTLVATMPLY